MMAAADFTEASSSSLTSDNTNHHKDESTYLGEDHLETKSLLEDYVLEDLPMEIVAVDQSELNRTDDNLRKVHSPLPYLGLVMAVLSSLFFSLCSLVVKLMQNIDPLQLAAFRFVSILLPTIPIVIYVQESPISTPRKNFLLLLRAICGAMSLMMQFYAIRHMPLADASVVIFSAPVFVTIFARIFLKEACGLFNVVVIILTLLGVVLITKPPFLFGDTVYAHGYTTDLLQGALVAFIGTIFHANVYVLLRWLKGLHYAVIMMNFSIVAIVMSFLASYFLGSLCWLDCGKDRFMVLLLGVLSFAGQVLLTKSLQYEQAGPVAICRTADIVFAFIWQVIFFHQVPDWFSVGGAFLVTLSVVLTGMCKWLVSLPQNSHWRRKFKFSEGNILTNLM